MTAGDVEALAEVIAGLDGGRLADASTRAHDACLRAARAILASPWLAARVADARREGGVAALAEAAEELPARTEGTDRVATETWQPNDRDVYSLAIEEAQSALRDCASRLAHREVTRAEQ